MAYGRELPMLKKIFLTLIAFLPIYAGANETNEEGAIPQMTVQVDGKLYVVTNEDHFKILLEEADLEEVDPDSDEIQIAAAYLTESNEDEKAK